MPISPGNSVGIEQAGLVAFDGSSVFTGSPITQHDILVGGASNAVTSVAPSATSGVAVISQGAAADPTFGTVVVAGGGTGVTSFTDTNALLCSGTTTTGALQDVASVATGQVLTSAGTSTLPAWSATPSVTSITLGGGSALNAYQSGTWTPTMVGQSTAGTTTYTVQSGIYVKIGLIVLVNFNVKGTLGSTYAGNFLMGGLPFAQNGTNGCDGIVFEYTGNLSYGTGYTTLFAQVGNFSSTSWNPVVTGSAKTPASLSGVALTQYGFSGTIVYQAAS